ncbi:transcription factor bHLH153 isoform X2 [Euphorbia lathyris]|uniref:transcription factor bHLH153 isoform X2 n=1 Tax=Euphorbia lathyris TaxID=212925 RepID=UPI0033139518
MDENEGEHFGEVGITTSFSQLLFSDIGENGVLCSDLGSLSAFGGGDDRCFSSKPPRMLCFDGYNKHNQKSAVTCCVDSSPISSAAAASGGAVNVSRRRTNGLSQETDKRNSAAGAAIAKAQRSSKKMKTENPCISGGQPKARKAKLGDRIAALQQLVSPYGKTDTASVLHEAMGYIKFLHDQIQVLSSPYLQHPEDTKSGGEAAVKDLRSRGLCLVPVDCTLHVASTNGADYWSPAMSSTRQ